MNRARTEFHRLGVLTVVCGAWVQLQAPVEGAKGPQRTLTYRVRRYKTCTFTTPLPESSSTRTSQIKGQIPRMLSPKTLSDGDFDCIWLSLVSVGLRFEQIHS